MTVWLTLLVLRYLSNQPQASTSATPSTQQATPKIRIKQSNPNAGTTTPSTLTSTSSATAAAPTAAAGIPQIKTEEAPSEANNNNNDNANASSTTTAATTTAATGKSPYPIKEDNTGFNSSLILPGKRKRTSLTPNNAAANSSNDSAANKANQHQVCKFLLLSRLSMYSYCWPVH